MTLCSTFNPNATKLERCTRRNRCLVCGRPRYCSNFSDGSACICMWVEAGSVRRTKNGGYLHRLKDMPRPKCIPGVRTRIIRSSAPVRDDLAAKMAEYRQAVHLDRLRELADALGVSAESLHRLGIGWSWNAGRDEKCDPMMRSGGGAWCFPMFDSEGRIIGIKFRLADGQKLSIRDGREGIFRPADLPDAGTLFIAEGASDTAALLDLGYAAVGRPSATCGASILADLVKDRNFAGVVIVADADAPGQRGAASVASELVLHVGSVKLITPPAKDVREWKRQGATHDDVMKVVDAAAVRNLEIQSRMIGGCA
jgi:hypothetical protein